MCSIKYFEQRIYWAGRAEQLNSLDPWEQSDRDLHCCPFQRHYFGHITALSNQIVLFVHLWCPSFFYGFLIQSKA